MEKPKIRKLLLIFLAVSIICNFYMYFKYTDFLNQKQSQNHIDLWSISVSGENLAKNLEEFLHHSHGVDNEEVQETLVNSWKIVLGESRSIHFYLGRVSPQYMKEFESKWSLLQYSLLKIDDLLHSLNMKFLEQGFHSINNEETEKLKAVVNIYVKIHEEVKKEPNSPELVIDSLTKQLVIIDDHYLEILERLEQE